ncbi:hypothetical protein NC652_040378 [Populus alba x Populus x berolinensis]|nr:hypothetical protein NC652_040378 [Populus alba x Populus x berolinensis]
MATRSWTWPVGYLGDSSTLRGGALQWRVGVWERLEGEDICKADEVADGERELNSLSVLWQSRGEQKQDANLIRITENEGISQGLPENLLGTVQTKIIEIFWTVSVVWERRGKEMDFVSNSDVSGFPAAVHDLNFNAFRFGLDPVRPINNGTYSPRFIVAEHRRHNSEDMVQKANGKKKRKGNGKTMSPMLLQHE